jgi:hypothetical protein
MRAAQGRKGAQQTQITCMMTANHKATGHTTTTPCCQVHTHPESTFSTVHPAPPTPSVPPTRAPHEKVRRAARGLNKRKSNHLYDDCQPQGHRPLRPLPPLSSAYKPPIHTLLFHCATCTTDAARPPGCTWPQGGSTNANHPRCPCPSTCAPDLPMLPQQSRT